MSGLIRQLLRHLEPPFAGFDLALTLSEVLTPPAHPLLGFSELVLSLGERGLTVRQFLLRPFVQSRLSARVAYYGGNSWSIGAANRDPNCLALALPGRPLRRGSPGPEP